MKVVEVIVVVVVLRYKNQVVEVVVLHYHTCQVVVVFDLVHLIKKNMSIIIWGCHLINFTWWRWSKSRWRWHKLTWRRRERKSWSSHHMRWRWSKSARRSSNYI
jgi:hypothetical protein